MTEPCQHEWQYVRDWWGDPNVIGGTQDCSHWYCEKCDTSTDEQPEDWIEPPDEEYDERRERLGI